MTPRTRVTLLLIVTLIDPSGQNCADYFNMAKWSGQNLTCTFPLAKTRDPRDLIRCTLRDACQRMAQPLLCGIQKSCFNAEDSWTCEGTSSQNISFYHLMCFAAKAKDDSIVPEGCKYESVCDLYRQVSLNRNPTTAPSSVLPTPTAPAAVCSLPPTPGTTTVTRTESREGDGSNQTGINDTYTQSPWFIISAFLFVLVVLLLLLSLYLWRTRVDRRQDSPVQSSNNDASTNEERSTAH